MQWVLFIQFYSLLLDAAGSMMFDEATEVPWTDGLLLKLLRSWPCHVASYFFCKRSLEPAWMCWNHDCPETTLIDLDTLQALSLCFFETPFQYPSKKVTKSVNVFPTKADLVLLRLGIFLAGWEAGSLNFSQFCIKAPKDMHPHLSSILTLIYHY